MRRVCSCVMVFPEGVRGHEALSTAPRIVPVPCESHVQIDQTVSVYQPDFDLEACVAVCLNIKARFLSVMSGSQSLATEPLRNSSITIKQVTAKRSRLVIEGEMAYDTAKVPFTYRTSIGVRGNVRYAGSGFRGSCDD